MIRIPFIRSGVPSASPSLARPVRLFFILFSDLVEHTWGVTTCVRALSTLTKCVDVARDSAYRGVPDTPTAAVAP